MVKEMEAFSKTKIKTNPKKDAPNSNRGGKTSMHKLTSILYFFKMNCRPPKWVFFAAYGILLCAILILILIVADYELVYNGIRGGFGHLELVVVVGGSYLA